MHGQLNSFQKTMLQWNELHAYNAVHIVRLSRALDVERVRRAIRTTLQSHGLTRFVMDRKQGTYSYQGGEASCEIRISDEVATVPEGSQGRFTSAATGQGWEAKRSFEILSCEIERELNASFSQGAPFDPFRFFVVPDQQAFFLGVTYFHPVADAEAVVRLMNDIVGSYTSGTPLNNSSINLYPGTHDSFRQRPSLMAAKLATLPRQIRRLRTSWRAPGQKNFDPNVAFSFLRLAPDQLVAMQKAAKHWDVTLNDLFLALLLKCFSPLANKRFRRRRRNLSVGCIVNTRRDLGLDKERIFGLFLGSFTVTHLVPDGITLEALARDVRRQTQAIKDGKLYLGAPLEMAFGRFMFSLFSTERRKKLYQKHYPLWGGITNMNLNSIWEQRPGEEAMDYFRAVSTGPVTPFVLSVTTVRDAVNIGITYRTAVFSAPQVEEFKRRFVDAFEQLTHS